MPRKIFACFFVLLLVSGASASELYQRTYERSLATDDDQTVFDDYIAKENAGTKAIDAVFDPALGVLGALTGSKGYVEDVKRGAERGSPYDQFEWGLMCEANKDYQTAFENYSKSANTLYERWRKNTRDKSLTTHLCKAYNNLALLYLFGNGVTQDKKKAFDLLLDASEKGYAKAQYNLANMYFDGVMGEPNDSEALTWYNKAANRNQISAIMFLASMYENGYKVQESPTEAFKFYRKAAELGYAPAQTVIGDMYYKGYGIKQNIPGALKWYKKAAAWKYPEAQYKLANMYYKGEGIKKANTSGAIKLWKESAKNGYTDSQNALKEIGQTW